ncbi:helix-turn-helix domain-containing protein [Enterococcus faecalis]|uniref:helix-turn-helix domain-containing protein n=1 Tax=Enterococcus faecalis TaxID=1351 RepID=UPI003D116C71
MELGNLLKEIRNSRGYTQEYVCKDIITRSYLSMIENNHYSPSISILLELLDRLNVDLDEFIFLIYRKQEKNNDNLRFLSMADRIHCSKDLTLLKDSILNSTFIKYNKKEHLLIVLEILTKFSNKHSLEEIQKEALPIKDYLKSINSWMIYDFRLFNNTMFCYSIDEILEMMPMIIDYTNRYQLFFGEKNAILNFISNFCIMLIMNKSYDEAYEYSGFGLRLLESDNSSPLTHELFLKSIYYYANSKLTSSISNCQKLKEHLSIARKLNHNNIVEFFNSLD